MSCDKRAGAVTGPASMVLMILLLNAGCRPLLPFPTMQAVNPGEQPPAGEAILIGMAGFDPPFEREALLGQDIMLGFTYSPDTPVSLDDGMTGIDLWANVAAHQPFLVAAPRRSLYLRTVRKLIGYTVRGSGLVTRISHLSCTGRKAIDIRPGDNHVYVGTFVCEHDEKGPLGITVMNQHDRIFPYLAGLTGDRPYRTQIAEDLDINPAVGEVAHAAIGPAAPSPGEVTSGTAMASAVEPGDTPPAAEPSGQVLSGTVRFQVAGQEVAPRAFAAAAKHERVALVLAGRSVELDSTGGFRLPVTAGRHRLDHLVLRGPGAARRVLFIPALEVEVGKSSSECLGTLLLTWDDANGPQHDGFPALTRTGDCGSTPSATISPARVLHLPSYGDPLP